MHFKFKKFSHANQNLLYSFRVDLLFKKKIELWRFSPLRSLKVSNYLFNQQHGNASRSYSYESLISLVLDFDCGSKIHI